MDTDGVARYGCRWVGETVIRRWGWKGERIRGWVGWCRAELIANPLDYVSWMGISTSDDGRPSGNCCLLGQLFLVLLQIKKECLQVEATHLQTHYTMIPRHAILPDFWPSPLCPSAPIISWVAWLQRRPTFPSHFFISITVPSTSPTDY